MKFARHAVVLGLLVLPWTSQVVRADGFVINDTSGVASLIQSGSNETVVATLTGPDSFQWNITPPTGLFAITPSSNYTILGTDGTTVVGVLGVTENLYTGGYFMYFTGCDPAVSSNTCSALGTEVLTESGNPGVTTTALTIPIENSAFATVFNDAIAVESAPIATPEPSTMILLSGGLLGLLSARRRNSTQRS